MVTSCPFLPCVFMFTHLGINACPLHLLLLNFLSAHSSANQSSCGFFPSLFATCIFRTCLQFIPHWLFITHVDDLPTHVIVHNNLISPSAALYHDNQSVTVLPPLAQLFPQIHSGFATLFLCGLANTSGSFLLTCIPRPPFS